MILYNASTGLGLRNKTRFLTRTNENTYSNEDLDANLNNWLQIFTAEVLTAMDGWDFKAEVGTTNLVANQQEYVLPCDLLKIKRVEVSYDGTNWEKVNFFDINERQTDTNDLSDFQKTEPYADLMDKSIMLYPIPTADVDGGLKIWYSKEENALANVTDEPSLAEPFQIGLCYGAAKDYYERHSEKPNFADRAVLMQRNLDSILAKLKDFYNTHNQDREYIFEPVNVDYDNNYND
jgi:hypothetical protein